MGASTIGVASLADSQSARRSARQALAGPGYWTLAAMGLAAAALFWLVHASIVDDAYITLSYARNVAFRLHWGLIRQVTSNTATSPLNVLLLAALTAVLRQPPWALAVLFVIAGVVLGYALLRTVRTLGLPVWGALIGWALVLANPLLLSTVGMEVILGAAVLGLLLMAAVQARPWAFGLYAGLAVLTRVDLGIFALVLFLAARRLLPGWWKALFAGAVVTVPWFTFSWIALGSFVPDTLIIKTLQEFWSPYNYGNGLLLYLRTYPAATLLAFLSAALGVFALLGLLGWAAVAFRRSAATARRLAVPAAFALAGVLHFLAYTRLGVPPYHWYYGPTIVSLSVFVALAVAALPPIARTFAAGLVGLVLAGQIGFDVHHGLPWQQAAITTNWATPAQYATIGTELPRLVGDHTVQPSGEIGTFAYFCDCAIVDPFSDRARLLPAITTITSNADPLGRRLLNFNYRFLDRTLAPLPVDYFLSHVPRPEPGLPSWLATSSWHGPGAPPTDGYYTLVPAR